MERDIKTYAWLLILMVVPCVIQYSEFSRFQNPIIMWGLEIPFLVAAFRLRDKEERFGCINFYLIWELISYVHGMFVANGYWDWKNLISNGLIYLIPVITYYFCDIRKNEDTLSIFYRYIPLIIIIMLPWAHMSHYYGRIMQGFNLLLLLFPYLAKKYKIISLTAISIVAIVALSDRSDNIRNLAALLIGLSMYPVCDHIRKILLPKISFLFMIAPIIFFILAITNTFNVLNMGDDMGWKEETMAAEGYKKDLFSDTRTFIYVEAIHSAIKYDYYLYGHSLAKGYESKIFAHQLSKQIGFKTKNRNGSETGIVNVFTYMGIIGVIIIGWIYITAVFKGIKRSNNDFIPVVGLYVAFRWMYSWVEEYQKFDFTHIFLWIMIAMCLSPQFRNMTNAEFKNYIKKITS